MIFDGRAFAKEIEERVAERVNTLPRKPHVVSVLVGDDPASELYTRLKAKAAERCGIQFEVIKLEISNNQAPIIKQTIKEAGVREEVTGVMVQLPVPGFTREETAKLLTAIPLAKDVDGLRWEESSIMPATVRAITSILARIERDNDINLQDLSVVVVGATGSVGRPLVHFLAATRGIHAIPVRSTTPDMMRLVRDGQVVVSCVGRARLVTGEMVRDQVVAVDVGMSIANNQSPIINNQTVVGDMTSDVYQKARVAVPVPGGVGPVTVACLMENAARLVE